ncbi:uncharacterized protein LOC108028125 isoform X2 [Drosophila biarmipes]|uniref:uncharacterized protein LOC108028125 isoform X2 n=1 Tax=Drosophila biarmipes TaxID=125945 RepID=UPI0021CCE92B|nr:uncharacterized protein LOC108028125 isoform X2 [Drosophila biarmipes]
MPHFDLNNHPYRRRIFLYRNLNLGHPQAGDFSEEEDPRQRGILRNTSCRRYRERLRSSRQSQLLQGVAILASVIVVLILMLFLGMKMSTEQMDMPPPREEGLWMGALRLLGLEQEDQLTGESYGHDGLCSSKVLDLRRIFRHMGRVVLNQEQALARMERALGGSGLFRSVALLGPPGVGKTLAANTLRNAFPWRENAHSYSWSTQVPDEASRVRLVRQFANGLSDCGVSLLIIDDLATCDHGLVPIYNRLILEREGGPNRNQTVLVIYIFNLEADVYWEQFELLQELPAETTIVNFRFFNQDDLRDCLASELKSKQRVLSREMESLVLEEAMEKLHSSGCKSLRQLVLRNGVIT